MYSADLAWIHEAGFGRHARALAPGILALLRAHGVDGGAGRGAQVVEIGCGGGVLARELVDAGYRVLGIDQSPAMIRLARHHAPGARFRVLALERARLPRCAVIIAIGEIITYVPSRRAVRDFFDRARGAIEPGGVLLFDFLTSVRGRTYHHRARAGDGWRIELSATADASGRSLMRRMRFTRQVGATVRRGAEQHRIRVYRRAEMAAMLRAAGFRALFRRALGGYALPAADALAIATPE